VKTLFFFINRRKIILFAGFVVFSSAKARQSHLHHSKAKYLIKKDVLSLLTGLK